MEIDKSYYKGTCELISGEGRIYTEFNGDVATRQITIINDFYYSSSSLEDWHEDIGFLLYDGKKSELDLSESKLITSLEFESEWDKTITPDVLNDYVSFSYGDASIPLSKSKMIIHIVNNKGKWGKGFVVPLSKRYPAVKEEYLKWFSEKKDFFLGHVQFICVNGNERIYVANMLAQDGLKKSKDDNAQYVSYEALKECLSLVSDYALKERLSIQLPMIGAGLGGGDWDAIFSLIKECLARKRIKCNIVKLG